jgi:uncharacterized membrane protein SpoIIM required for sporulation
MKETRFISQNKQKWQEAEALLESDDKDPEKLSSLFVQVVDDLSYSRTYYPNRSVRLYLNKIARQFFSIIYSQKKEKRNQFKLFWKDELPQIVFYCRKELTISFIVFVVSVAIGVFSSAKDKQFTATILGDSYVAMTDENIAKGDPMAVYKKSHQVDMFLGITFNNLMVAFRTYVLGIFLCIGTLASLLFNGVMVGSFQYYFLERGLFIQSASSIWLHGTLEMSSIILAGGAGLTLGRGLIFPGTYSRLQSLQISGVRSLKLMLGITPIFILAAVIESFLTRYTEAPSFLKLLLILLSALFMIGYFVVYPWRKAKNGFEVPLKETRLQPSDTETTNFVRIKSNADLLKDAFQFYFRNSAALLSWSFAVAVCLGLISLVFETEPLVFDASQWWVGLFGDMFYTLQMPTPLFICTNAIGTSLILYQVMKRIDVEAQQTIFSFDRKAFLHICVIMLAIYAAIYFGILGILFALCAFGVLMFSGFVQLTQKSSLTHGLAEGWELFGKNNGQGVGLQFIVLLISLSFLLLFSAPLLYIHMNVLQWNFVASDAWSQAVIRLIQLFVKILPFYLVLPMFAASLSYLYYSQVEVVTATNLKESISNVGKQPSKLSER